MLCECVMRGGEAELQTQYDVLPAYLSLLHQLFPLTVPGADNKRQHQITLLTDKYGNHASSSTHCCKVRVRFICLVVWLLPHHQPPE